MLTKQVTKHVEWYHEDFSDPEAVSGSSTKLQKLEPGGSFLWSKAQQRTCGKLNQKL